MPTVKDQDYIRLHMGPLADGIKKHARQWINLYGQKLQENASQSFVSLQEILVVRSRVKLSNVFVFGATLYR